MKILETPHDFRAWRQSLGGRSVGFVPTMGALHAGHESLLKRARGENDVVVLSIFVNPTQFNDPGDFSKYPKTWEADTAMARAAGVDAIFAPNREVMYPDDYKYKVTEGDFSARLCGASRPGHFDGVLTVVMKIFQIVAPQRAYFGEKDFQQLTLIQGMVDAFFLPLQIIPVSTMREKDGLAMSSRNVRLTPEQRALAPMIYQIIRSARESAEAARLLNEAGFRVDYVTDIDRRRYVAAFLGEVRLIDNVELSAK
jgi:pantoate--beta-alanine ligase